MRKYPMALDAAPQDGRWLDDPAAMKTALMFLLSKLPPDQLAELDTHVAEGTAPQATDHRLPDGNLKREWLSYTPRNRASMRDSLLGSRPDPLAMSPAEREAIHTKLFPNAGRLK